MVVVINEGEENEVPEPSRILNCAVFFDNEHDSDVSFIVGATHGDTWRFPGHTRILANKNVRLRELFRHMPPTRTISINDVDKRGFEYLLRCLYDQEINFSKVETALNALKTGVKYQCWPLVEKSVKYVDLQLNYNNVLDILIEIGLPTATREGDSDLAKIERYINRLRHNCLVLIDRQASRVLENERFEDLTREQVEYILQRDSLQVHREFEVWKALERWLNRECKRLQKENTNSMKREILGNTIRVVRFSLMRKREFTNGPSSILFDTEKEEVFRQMQNRERRYRNAKVDEPYHLNPNKTYRRWSTASNRSNGSQIIKNRIYDICLSCLVCIFD